MSTNGTWWNGDLDVFYMRRENVSMSAAEAWCLAGQIPTKLEDQSLLIGPMPPHSLRIQKFVWA